MSTDITPATPMLSATQLREIESMDDAVKVLGDTFGFERFDDQGLPVIPEAAEEIGDGFSVTKDKDQFIGIRLLVVNMNFAEGDYATGDGDEKGEFVTVWTVSVRGKHKFADGSTGIYRQLRDYFNRTGKAYLSVANGLRRSDYQTTDERGREITGTTYYLDTTR